ncbi:hypothetical protein [Alphabaculovirus myunipunctae]|uniref:Uncharacterized protein n=1 Tax=Mythimna unipuncta nucleopolyhedrovirus TaxID=447897 RepID=A0A2K9VS69_9ABAC|nr:hypothetical protein [Mythimna unipuncta nucleopolyhedrovirus]AUV65292.1 hypothetical protein [Mythimna unipuncta nucleopolyhedrovirus]
MSCSFSSSPSTTTTTTTTTITVYVNGVETPFVSMTVNRLDNIITYYYRLCTSTTTTAPTATPSTIRVKLDTKGSRLQAVFKCGKKLRCVVNARDIRQPIVFDGFESENDESRTDTFLVYDGLKALKPDRGLRVRQMARAMESPTVLQIFVNEAILFNSSDDVDVAGDDDDDDDVSLLADDTEELQSLLKRLLFDEQHNADDDDIVADRQCSSLKTTTRWAPVQCKTGRHLITYNLVFTNNRISR